MSEHRYILKTQAVAICTHCDRALDTEDILCRINAHDELVDATKWVLRSAGYEKGEASDKLHELSVGRQQLDSLLTAASKAKEK